jgi:methanogenic corrinoid protein MtbC1
VRVIIDKPLVPPDILENRVGVMHILYGEFLEYLDKTDKQRCVDFCLSHLADGSLDVVTLYRDILSPALREQSAGIWEEHVRTSIVRTIIESCYLNVIKERDEKYKPARKGNVLVVCPPEEAHEVGARMVADFFVLCGYEVTFIGANTPREEIVDAVGYFKPLYVAISITNAFNLVAAGKAVKKILDLKKSLDFTLILGGQACKNNPDVCGNMNPDMMLDTFDDIRRLSEGEADAPA